jgi:ferredoxin
MGEKQMNNVSSINPNNCYGCGACEYVCPTNAISMADNIEGFKYPIIDSDLCLECGNCLDKCQVVNNNFQYRFKVVEQFGCKHKNSNIREHSRSGGAFVAISDIIINQGGSVYGAAFFTPDKILHIRTETQEERDALCGSKYVQSNISPILRELEMDLQDKRLVLFSGTSCQCAAIALLFDRDQYPNLLLCDFACHGVPSPKLWKDFINFCETNYNGKAISADFRNKSDYGWKDQVEQVTLENKIVNSKRYANLFYSNLCLRSSCYQCGYASKERISDITLADFWGIDNLKPEFNDNHGVSLVLISTPQGKQIFHDALTDMDFFPCNDYTPAHYNFKRPTSCPENRPQFWQDYDHRGFEFVSKKYGGYDFLHYLKHKVVDKIPD